MPQAHATEWTPYPHEAVRVRLLWRRRLLIIGIIIAILLAWLTLFETETSEVETISVLSGDGSQVTVQRQVRPDRGYEGPDATISVRPGETANAAQIQQEADDGQSGPTLAPPPENPPEGIPFLGLAVLLGPFLLLPWILRRLGERSSTEVNFGVYKGAMPLEMITAEYRKLVQTSKAVGENPFGKVRSDYLADAGVDEAGVAVEGPA